MLCDDSEESVRTREEIKALNRQSHALLAPSDRAYLKDLVPDSKIKFHFLLQNSVYVSAPGGCLGSYFMP